MTKLIEQNLQITIPNNIKVRKFDDDASHGLSNCMKAVDFIIEMSDRYLFIEFKDPEHPKSRPKDRNTFISNFLSGNIDADFKYKYRDSFLYEYASGRADKPVYYYVLVAIEKLTEAELITRTDDLNRQLPLRGPKSGEWKHSIVAGCAVFNIATWNLHLNKFPIQRI